MDRFRCGKILITCCVVLMFIWVAMIGCTSLFYADGNTTAAKASVAFVLLIGVVVFFAYTPLQLLFPKEILSFQQRAKALTFAPVYEYRRVAEPLRYAHCPAEDHLEELRDLGRDLWPDCCLLSLLHG
jgi:hypothetical protein